MRALQSLARSLSNSSMQTACGRMTPRQNIQPSDPHMAFGVVLWICLVVLLYVIACVFRGSVRLGLVIWGKSILKLCVLGLMRAVVSKIAAYST